MKTAMNKVETEIKKERKTSETLSVPFCGYTRWGAINKLAGLLAMGVVLSAAGPALGRPGLHVVPTPVVNDPLVAVAGSASNDVWAVGSQTNVGDSPTPFIAHWNG